MRWHANTPRWLAIALALTVALLLGGSATAAGPHSAGIVVRHGDGTLVYVWVSFEEDSITSEELLTRSGLDAVVTPFGGLGMAVCSLDGEGCPSDNCFCKSFSNPAYFWHFYTSRNGAWVQELSGPSGREVHDGDVDGWSWTAGDAGLPAVTLDEIAALNGVRSPPAASPVEASATTAAAATTQPQPAASPTVRAIVIPPGGTPATRVVAPETDTRGTSWPIFAGMAAAAIVAGGLVIVRRRKPRGP